jgi:hypothetical protein
MSTSSALAVDAAFLHAFSAPPSPLTWWLSLQLREIAKLDGRAILPKMSDVYDNNITILALTREAEVVWVPSATTTTTNLETNEGFTERLYQAQPSTPSGSPGVLCLDQSVMSAWDTKIHARLLANTSRATGPFSAGEQLDETLFTEPVYRNFVKSRLPRTALLAATLTDTAHLYAEALYQYFDHNMGQPNSKSEVALTLQQLSTAILGPGGHSVSLLSKIPQKVADFVTKIADYDGDVPWNMLLLGVPKHTLLSILTSRLSDIEPQTSKIRRLEDALFAAIVGDKNQAWWKELTRDQTLAESIDSYRAKGFPGSSDTTATSSDSARIDGCARITLGLIMRFCETYTQKTPSAKRAPFVKAIESVMRGPSQTPTLLPQASSDILFILESYAAMTRADAPTDKTKRLLRISEALHTMNLSQEPEAQSLVKAMQSDIATMVWIEIEQ